MRKETLKEILYCVGELKNIYLDNPNEEPITLDNAIRYVYDEIIRNAEENRFRLTTAIKFDGKQKILNKIKEELLKSEEIKFKNIINKEE